MLFVLCEYLNIFSLLFLVTAIMNATININMTMSSVRSNRVDLVRYSSLNIKVREIEFSNGRCSGLDFVRI